MATISRRPRTAETLTPGAAKPAPSRTPAVIEFRNVIKTYEGGNVGLDEQTFNIQRGDFVFVVGHSGSGKSTIMRLLLKELEPTSGSIRVAGRELTEIPAKKVPYYRRNVSVVFQDYKLLPTRTVYDNVAYALQVTGHSRKDIRTKVPDILPHRSGHQAPQPARPALRRGAAARSRWRARSSTTRRSSWPTSRPATSTPRRRSGSCSLLYRINRTGTTVVVATHDLHMVERMKRRVIKLHKGVVVSDRPAGLQKPQTTDELGAMLRGEVEHQEWASETEGLWR